MNPEAEWVARAFERNVATGIIITTSVIFVFLVIAGVLGLKHLWNDAKSFIHRMIAISADFLSQQRELIDSVKKTGEGLTRNTDISIRLQQDSQDSLRRIEQDNSRIIEAIDDLRGDVRGIVLKSPRRRSRSHGDPDSDSTDNGIVQAPLPHPEKAG